MVTKTKTKRLTSSQRPPRISAAVADASSSDEDAKMEEVVVEGEEGKDDEDEGNSISKLVNHRSTPTSS